MQTSFVPFCHLKMGSSPYSVENSLVVKPFSTKPFNSDREYMSDRALMAKDCFIYKSLRIKYYFPKFYMNIDEFIVVLNKKF